MYENGKEILREFNNVDFMEAIDDAYENKFGFEAQTHYHGGADWIPLSVGVRVSDKLSEVFKLNKNKLKNQFDKGLEVYLEYLKKTKDEHCNSEFYHKGDELLFDKWITFLEENKDKADFYQMEVSS